MRRPGRAKMCNWLSGALFNLAHVMPFNPADTEQMALNARDADDRIRHLAFIANELGWHADADLDRAWELIQEYDALPPRPVAEDHHDRIRNRTAPINAEIADAATNASSLPVDELPTSTRTDDTP